MVEMHDWALLVQWLVWVAGITVLAALAYRNQCKAEALASALLDSHAWVDEIIEALENHDQESGDDRIGRLLLDSPVGRGDDGPDVDLHVSDDH